jgi:predicted acylesterase/phospholipase RssA
MTAPTDQAGQRPPVIERRILTIDGGGLRGIVAACLLAELERQLRRPAREVFDFIAGTSSGALTAGALVAGGPAARLVELYERRAGEIFARVPFLTTLRRVLTGVAYDVGRLHAVVRDELGDARGWRLNDAPVDVLITAKRLVDGVPWYFVRDRPTNSRLFGTTLLADAVTASAAAPTYFAPWPIAGVGELIDGGIGVTGNPVYQACVEAFDYTDAYEPSRTLVVSLGTGQHPRLGRPRWIWPWLEWLLTELLRSPAEQQTQLVDRHWPEAVFYRIDLELERPLALDDVGRLGELRRIGERFAAEVEWPAIIDAATDAFRVTPRTRQPQQYRRSA